MIKIDFEIQTQHGVFRDAIHSSVELTEQEIEAIKTERVNNWVAVIEAPEEDHIPDATEMVEEAEGE